MKTAPATTGALANAMDRALARYMKHLGTRGYRSQGMATAQRYITDFTLWANERGVTHPSQVSRAVLERYQRSLYHYRQKSGKPLSIASQRCKLTPLRGFFRWLTRVGEIPANPAADLELPKKIRRLPRVVLTAAEVERVMAAVDTTTAIGLRDRAMLEVLCATGMRRMELARLETSDVDGERCVVLIREGKGGKDRLIPLGERALHWLRQYLEQAREQLAWNPLDKTLFLGNKGKPLSPLWLSTVIAKRVDAAQLDKRGGPHLFRHTMATLMLEGGADIRFIQAMLGHAEISTTQIYTQVAIRQLSAVHALTHPGAMRRIRGVQTSADIQALTLIRKTRPEPWMRLCRTMPMRIPTRSLDAHQQPTHGAIAQGWNVRPWPASSRPQPGRAAPTCPARAASVWCWPPPTRCGQGATHLVAACARSICANGLFDA